MSVYKRNGIWYARAQVGGQRVERSLGPLATQEEAKEYEAALFKQLRDDRHAHRIGRSPNRLFGAALVEYLKHPETKSLRSFQSSRSVIRLIKPYLEHVPLENTPEACEKMKKEFLEQGLKPATINRRLALVRRVLKLAYRWKWTSATLTVPLLTESNERHIYPTTDIARALAAACPNRNAGYAVLILFFTGMRRSEFFKVNRGPGGHIDGEFIRLYSGTKTNRPGRIPIMPEIAPLIRKMPLDLTPHELRINFEIARKAVGMPDLHLHDLRHGFASLLAEAGADFLDIMSLLRHASPTSTKRYTHLLDKRLQNVMKRAGKVAGKRRSESAVKKYK